MRKHSDYKKLDDMAYNVGLEVEYLLVESVDGRDYIMLYDGEELVAEGSYEVVYDYLQEKNIELLDEMARLLSEPGVPRVLELEPDTTPREVAEWGIMSGPKMVLGIGISLDTRDLSFHNSAWLLTNAETDVHITKSPSEGPSVIDLGKAVQVAGGIHPLDQQVVLKGGTEATDEMVLPTSYFDMLTIDVRDFSQYEKHLAGEPYIKNQETIEARYIPQDIVDIANLAMMKQITLDNYNDEIGS